MSLPTAGSELHDHTSLGDQCCRA